MARPRRIDSDLVTHAKVVANQAQDIQELRMAQAVLLPALAQMSLEQTATVLGVGRATVARLQRRFRRHERNAEPLRPPWGGRRRALMSVEDEREFLADWKPKAEQGELVVLPPLRAALQKKLGRLVKPSVVYRLLQRHRWRKVAPDTRHPKAEPAVQDEWKKKRFRKSWWPC
jgi:transposase